MKFSHVSKTAPVQAQLGPNRFGLLPGSLADKGAAVGISKVTKALSPQCTLTAVFALRSSRDCLVCQVPICPVVR